MPKENDLEASKTRVASTAGRPACRVERERNKPLDETAASPQPVSKQTGVGTLKRSAAMDKPKESNSKPQNVRQAQRHRKPVMMVLRTIEFADGRHEEHLLSMSQSRASAY